MAFTISSADLFAIRDAIREWVRLLASRDFDRAEDFLIQPTGEFAHTAAIIESEINRYSPLYRESQDPRHKPTATDPASMNGEGENLVVFLHGNQDPVIEYELPLDGMWSDLTVKFSLVKVETGYGLMVLDIRTL